MEKRKTILMLIWLLIVSGIIGFVIIGMWSELGAETGLDAGLVILAFVVFGYALRDFVSKISK